MKNFFKKVWLWIRCDLTYPKYCKECLVGENEVSSHDSCYDPFCELKIVECKECGNKDIYYPEYI